MSVRQYPKEWKFIFDQDGKYFYPELGCPVYALIEEDVNVPPSVPALEELVAVHFEDENGLKFRWKLLNFDPATQEEYLHPQYIVFGWRYRDMHVYDYLSERNAAVGVRLVNAIDAPGVVSFLGPIEGSDETWIKVAWVNGGETYSALKDIGTTEFNPPLRIARNQF